MIVSVVKGQLDNALVISFDHGMFVDQALVCFISWV